MRAMAAKVGSVSASTAAPDRAWFGVVEIRRAEVVVDLDWTEYSAAFFPGRRRHDLEALVAYGAYKRAARLVDRHMSIDGGEPENADTGAARSTASQTWEDEAAPKTTRSSEDDPSDEGHQVRGANRSV